MKTVRVLVLVALTSLHTAAHADVIISFQEVGSDVVVEASGAVDLTGATFKGNMSATTPVFDVYPAYAVAILFPPNSTGGVWTLPTTTRPAFGTGQGSSGQYVSGSAFFALSPDSYSDYALPPSYVSGSFFSVTGKFPNSTFSSMGITPGTYTWTAGNNNMTLTTQAVPEPATSAMALVGVAYSTYSMFRRRKQA